MGGSVLRCFFRGSRFLSAAAPPALDRRGVAVLAAIDAPRTRRSFARHDKVLDVPNLIAIQRKSFAWLTDPEKGGLRETIDDISPIEDYTGNLAGSFAPFTSGARAPA